MFWFIVSFIFAIAVVIFVLINRRLSDEKERLFEEKIKLENTTVILKERLNELEEKYNQYRKEHVDEYANLKKDRDILVYKNFIKAISKEIERLKRKEELKFCVMQISLDFIEKYDEEGAIEIKKQIFKFLDEEIRVIDSIGIGEEKKLIYLLLPMTSAEGAVILGARLQKKSETYKINYKDKKINIVFTMSVCEINKETKPQDIIEALNIIKRDSEEINSSIVKIVKI